MLARLLMKQVNKNTGKMFFWYFKEMKPAKFWPGAIHCLNSSAYFHSTINDTGSCCSLSGESAQFWEHELISVLPQTSKIMFISLILAEPGLRWLLLGGMGRGEGAPAMAGRRAEEGHAWMVGRSRQGAALMYTYTGTAAQLQLQVGLHWCFSFSTKQHISLVCLVNS